MRGVASEREISRSRAAATAALVMRSMRRPARHPRSSTDSVGAPSAASSFSTPAAANATIFGFWPGGAS